MKFLPRGHAPLASTLRIGLALVAAIASHAAAADDAGTFPNRAAKVVVPFTPGGTGDILPRAIAEKLSNAWKQPVIIDNKPGAGGNIGAKFVADANPDGYTLLASPPGPLAINQSIFRALPFDPAKLEPVSLFAMVPIVLAVRNTLPVNSVQELIALAKSSPGKLTYASAGPGSTPHLVGSMFASMANVELVHVPYKGSSQPVTDLIGGQVDIYFDNLTNAQQFYKSGRIKLLGVASDKRSSSIPAVPTIKEAGLANFTASTWYGAALPAGTPPSIIAKWNAGINDALASPDMQQRLRDWGAEVVGGTPAEAASFMKAEAAKWKAVAAQAKVLVD
jgi:tripartite-type tricarboxylate transporter receptor subunit TctC